MSALGARGRLLHIWSPWYPVTSTRRARCASAPRKYTSSPLASAARNGSSGPAGASGPRQASRAVGAIVGQLRRLCDEPVEAAELTKAKEFYKGRLLLQMESTNSVATWYGGQEALTGKIQDVDDTVAEIDAVTADDVRRIARELFSQALQLAVIGPFRSEAPFLKQIA